jgi:hypothetical protein
VSFNPFSVLTSKIFGGALLALLIYHGIDELGDRRRYAALDKKYVALKTENGTLALNVGKHQLALNTCNQGVKNAAEVASTVAASGEAAVRAVQQAGQASAARAVRSINAAPARTCEDAEAILRGEAG